ncbi:phosphoglucosamine mutase, partial [Candidatus Parcubacteria bacterium]|nr:phosphoglucosamine mutase [Candidatus Parcubacteria bacterium]
EIHYGRDSLVGIAAVINLMRRTGKTLSELAAGLSKYEMRKIKMPILGAKLHVMYEKIRNLFPNAETNTEDGLRLAWADKWLHVRPSNTEPIFRIYGEAKTAREIDELIGKVTSLA